MSGLIERDKAALLSLPFVRTAPFAAAAMLTVFFGGGLTSAIVFALASAALIYLLAKKKTAWLSAAAVMLGVLVMMRYMAGFYLPVRAFAGKTISTEISVTEITKRYGQSEELIARAKLGGKSVKLRLLSGEVLLEDHRAAVTIELDAAQPTVKDLAQGILLSGEITEIGEAEFLGFSFASGFRAIRGSFYGALARNVFGESGELASAMLFGEDEWLSPQSAEYLRVSGAAHYTAVSGAHFAVFAAALLSIIPQKRRKARLLVSLLFAPAGLLFYGFSLSVLRASVMFFIYSLGLLLHKKANTLNSLCIALTVIPLISPPAILDAGFWMSVLGVFGVGVIGPEIAAKLCEFIKEKPDTVKRVLTPIITTLACSLCAVICTAPISAFVFKCVAPVGAITSILLAPLMAVAMTFMLLLGAIHVRLFAVPIDWAMRLASFIIKLFGKMRVLVISMDFRGAWIPAAVLAIIVTLCAFCDMKIFVRLGKIALALLIIIPVISAIKVANRREIRFIGSTTSSAAIILDGSSARLYISGGGDGLSQSISGVLRECGATKITALYAPDLDYGGALAVRALSDMVPISEIHSNEIAAGLLPERPVDLETSRVVEINGITIGSASAADVPSGVDILLYSGRVDKITESPARVAVYFTREEKELPGNFHNPRVDEEFCVKY
ncbi:MAG: ComEC/Rec2 family competence protein [Oscillospiraceae bacterium]|nr:ComEC/Rec2 family competence protein [Oscillospiraceae bacterium]